MAKRTNIKGLTLIELMIVVAIIVALATIAVPRISQSAARTKANACWTNIDILNQAIEQYNLTNEAYPDKLRTVSGNTNLFPDGPPRCPVFNTTYPNALTANNRVNASGHLHALDHGAAAAELASD